MPRWPWLLWTCKTAALPSGEIGCGTPHHCEPISQLAIEPAELLDVDDGPRPDPKETGSGITHNLFLWTSYHLWQRRVEIRELAVDSGDLALSDELVGCVEEAELSAIVDAIEAYETERWPLGKIPGGKG
jgi:hypothetical protein